MAIPYLEPGDSITADRWNTLFEEFDGKLCKLLNNKSLYTVDNIHSYLVSIGAVYKVYGYYVDNKLFLQQVTDMVDYGYHSTYTSAAASATVISTDYARRIVDCQPIIIDPSRNTTFPNSLQALTKTIDGVKYYIRQSSVLEKIYRYTSIDIIVEQWDSATFTFAREYDKYNFFRIHNLNNFVLTFTFEGTDEGTAYSVNIPAFGSICIRRTDVDTGYVEGYKHLHKMLAGDPRLFYPRTDLRSNNVCYPLLVSELAGIMDGNITQYSDYNKAPQFIYDPSTPWDASEYYEDYFDLYPGDEEKQNLALVGDVVHQKGTLLSIKTNADGSITQTPIQYNGYHHITSDFAAAGIDIIDEVDSDTSSDTYGQRFLTAKSNDVTALHHDVLQTGTNLFSKSGQQSDMLETVKGADANYFVPLIDVSSEAYEGPDNTGELEYRHIDSHVPDIEINPVDATNVSAETAWNGTCIPTYGCTTGLVVNNGTASDGDGGNVIDYELEEKDASPTGFCLWNTGIAEVKEFNCFGSQVEDYLNSYQNTAWGTFGELEDRKFYMTGAGPVIIATQRVSLKYYFSDGITPLEGNRYPYKLDTSKWTINGEYLERTVVIHFYGYGFPYTYINGGLFWKHGYALLTPRVDRSYGKLTPAFWGDQSDNPIHTDIWERDITNYAAREDGDFDFKSLLGNNQTSTDNPLCYVEFQTPNSITIGELKTAFPVTKSDALMLIREKIGDDDFDDWYTAERTRLLKNGHLPTRAEALPEEWTDEAFTIWWNEVWRFIRIPLSIEFYNNTAQLVNSIVRYSPPVETVFRFLAPTANPYIKTYTRFIEPNEAGIFLNNAGVASGPRPRGQYAGFQNGDASYSIVDSAGITIHDSSDLPDITGDTTLLRSSSVKNLSVVISPDEIAYSPAYTEFGIDYWHMLALSANLYLECGHWADYATRNFTGTLTSEINYGFEHSYSETEIAYDHYLFPNGDGHISSRSTFCWCDVDDVLTCAESIGVHFSYTIRGVPAKFYCEDANPHLSSSYTPTIYAEGVHHTLIGFYDSAEGYPDDGQNDYTYTSDLVSSYVIASDAGPVNIYLYGSASPVLSFVSNYAGYAVDSSEDFEWLISCDDSFIENHTDGDITTAFVPIEITSSQVVCSSSPTTCSHGSSAYQYITAFNYPAPVCGEYGTYYTAPYPGDRLGLVFDIGIPEEAKSIINYYPCYYWRHVSNFDFSAGVILYPKPFVDFSADDTGYSDKGYWYYVAKNPEHFPAEPGDTTWATAGEAHVIRYPDPTAQAEIYEITPEDDELILECGSAPIRYKMLFFCDYAIE